MIPSGGGGSATSSAYPDILMGLASYTSGISEGLTGVISAATEALSLYGASCDPTFFPIDDSLAPKATSWSNGLQELGQWTKAVGQAFYQAATDGTLDFTTGANGERGLPFVPSTGAQEIDFYGIAEDAGWSVPDSELTKLLPPQFRSNPFLNSDAGSPVQWSSDPYSSLLDYLKNPAKDAGLGATMLDEVATVTPEGSDVTGALKASGTILDGVGTIIGAATEFVHGYQEDGGGVTGAAAAALHAGLNVGGDYLGATIGEAIGEGLGEVAGPVGGLIGGFVLGSLVGAVTNDLFGPSTTDQAKDEVSGASVGSSVAANTMAEQQAIHNFEKTDPSLVPAAKQTLSAVTQTITNAPAYGRFGPVAGDVQSSPTYTPWHPAS